MAPPVVSDAHGHLCALTPWFAVHFQGRHTAKRLLPLTALIGSLAFPKEQGEP